MKLVLASTSSARRALMDSLGIRYEAIAPLVEEDVAPGTTVMKAVAELAERKARAVFAARPDDLVLGADQLVSLDGAALGKPVDRHAAREQLRALRGRTHEICTGVFLCGPRVAIGAVDVARMTLFPLADEELERYLDLQEWRGCAGGYRVESAGQALFSSIDGDRTSVQGLPMLQVVRLLRSAGVNFFENPRT